MRSPVVTTIIIVVSLIAVGFLAFQRHKITDFLYQRGIASSPLATCKKVSQDEAQDVAEKFVTGMIQLNEPMTNATMDLPLMYEEAIHEIPMKANERTSFMSGIRQASAAKNAVTERWIQALSQEGHVKLLVMHEQDGHQHARVRLLIDGGVNYLDLVIARTPTGKIQIIDFFDMAGGNYFTKNLTVAVLPLIAEFTKTPIERLAQSISGSSGIPMSEVGKIREHLQANNIKAALELYQKLPQSFRESRIGLTMHMEIAQKQGEKEYLAVMTEIEKRFPNDSTLALIQMDAFLLREKYDESLAAVDKVDAAVGGDPYLDCLRAGVCVSAKRLPEAIKFAENAVKREPELKVAWVVALSVALEVKDHAKCITLMDELQKRFAVEFLDDLSGEPSYKDLIASPEYAAWRSRQRNN